MTVNMQKVSQANLVAEVKAIDKEIARLTAEKRIRTEALAASVGNTPGKRVTESGTFTVAESNTYSEDAMRAALSPGQVRRVSKSVLDKPTVKRLYPEVYAAAKVPNGVKVTIG